MGIIIKFVLTNIMEKKFRTFLIVFAVIISTAIFFASSTISTTMEAMLLEQMEKYTGSADILIQSADDAPSRFFNPQLLAPWADELEYSAGTLGAHGFYQGKDESLWFQVQGAVWAEVAHWNPVILAQENELQPFLGNKIVLGQEVAERLGLNVGDSLELEIVGVTHEFVLTGVAQAHGPFMDDGRTTFAMIPRRTLAGIIDEPGMVSAMYIKANDPHVIQELIAGMQHYLPGLNVLAAGLDEQSRIALDSLVMPFLLITVIIFILSAYIIYTSFRLIAVERLPMIGTFRSVGATKAKTNMVMLLEGTLYGVMGGVLGCLLGLGILRLMATTLASTRDSTAEIVFTSGQMAVALAMALILTFLSSLLPILATGKLILKDIMLNVFDTVRKPGKTKTVVGSIILAAALVLPRFATTSLLLPTAVLSLFLIFAAIIMLVPFVTGLLVGLVEKVYGLVAGNIGLLAAKNLRENQNILNSVTLLALGIATLLLINTLSFSVLGVVTDVWRQNITHDIRVNVPGADADVVEEVAAVPGVTEVMPVYVLHHIGVEGSPYKISWLDGITPSKYLNFYSVDVSQQALDSLDKGRNILLASFMANLLEVKSGDKIILETSSGPKEYTVAGIIPVLFNNGSYGAVSSKWLEEDMQLSHYTNILVNADDPDVVAATLREALNYRRAQVITIAALEYANFRTNEQTFMILQGFSILMMIIGIVGVINNLLVSFLQRRRSLAMLRSVGMSRGQIRLMIMWESLTGGMIGGTIGVGSGLLLLAVLPWVLEGMLLPVPLMLSSSLLVSSWFTGVLVMVLASVALAFSSSRLNIIQAIKFE